MNAISFDKETHRYTIAGRTIPSVTQVLKRLYDWDGIPDAVLEYARERGSMVHKACELLDCNDLDYDDLDAQLVPYMQAWKSFKQATGFIPKHIEQPFYSERLGVCGTPDRVGVLSSLTGKPAAVIEIKATAEISPVAALQLAGYQLILRDNDESCYHRYIVLLQPSGKYKLQSCPSVLDIPVFLGELQSYKWRLRHGK